MGRIAKLLSFIHSNRNGAKVSDVKVDPGGGPNITAEHYGPAGDDSHPLNTDYVALNPDSGSGRETAIGYVDPINEPKAGAGDKRIYSRQGSDGSVVAEVWLKSSGQIEIKNGDGSITLQPDGSTNIVSPESSIEVASSGAVLISNSISNIELGSGGGLVSIIGIGTLMIGIDGSFVFQNPIGLFTILADGSMTQTAGTTVFSVATAGAIVGSNAGGNFTLTPGGQFLVNGNEVAVV